MLVTNVYGSTNSAVAVLTVTPCAPVSSGMVSWWSAEGNANDIVGVNNGTLVGGASFVAGEVGQAFSFDGSSGYVSIPDSPSLDSFTTSLTIELWLKVNQLTANSDWVGIVTKGNSSWRLMGTTFANTVYLGLDGVNGYLNGSRNINDGQWHHVAAVYDGTNMFLYVDGTLDVSQPATGLIAQNSYPVYIGQNAQTPMLNFNGLIDEVSLYNRALTASEIQTIYTAGSGGKCYTPTAPVIVSQPTNQVAYVGFTAAFSVVAGGTPPLSYQWNFNGTNIVGATNPTLTLTNVQYSQAGNYTVLVTNLYGSILSSNATLLVMNQPPVAMPDTVVFLVGTPQVSFNVLSNDYDVDGDPLTVQSFTSPARGALAQINNGQFTYQPNPNFTNGQDQFTYSITDSHGGTAERPGNDQCLQPLPRRRRLAHFWQRPESYRLLSGALGGATFVAAWSTNFGIALNQVAVGGGKVYATPVTYFGSTYLVALDATTGQLAWRHDFATAFSINPPTFDSNSVYVQRGDAGSDTQLWRINAADGSVTWSAPFGAQWERYYAPTVVGDGIWVDGGYYGGMYGFSTNGTQRFFYSGLQQYDQWTPTYYQGTIYTWVGGVFNAHDPMTGTVLWNLNFGWNWDGWSMNTVSAIDGGLAFVQRRPNLIAIDLAAHTNIWIATGGMTGSPAVAKGIVYAIFGNQVKAFAAQNGVSLGAYQAANDTGLAAQPIVTDDALLVASSSSTYVFDLSSHQLIQTIPYGGTLSLANGRLYIAGQDGWLRVYTVPNIGPAVLSVIPSTGLTANGPVGGPFNPSSQVYSLVNNGGASLNWAASQNANWVVLSDTNGSLAAGTAANVTVSINSNANVLAIGSYSASVTFTNLTNGNGTTNRIVALTVTPPPPCAPVSSGMVSWWSAEGNANDIVGVNNGTLVGGASFVAGEVGQAFSFDGSSGYVSIPDSPSLDSFITSITIELWLKVNQLTANSDWVGIVTKGNSSWRLMGTTFANTVYLGLDGVNGYLNGSRNINDGQWHHVAAVYDGTNMFLYVDGTLDVSQPATGLIAQNSYPVYIGQNAQTPMLNFNGLIDEVSLYNRALTASEIQTIYAVGSRGKCYTPTAPVIVSQPTNQVVYLGFTAAFSVMAGGTPPLSYQWNFNGTNIVGATNTFLTLTNVQLSQAGNYVVLVTNVYGSTNSAVAVLTVNPPPPCAPVSSGMVSWWSAEGNANDIVGVNNGTLVGGASFVAGEVGQAFSFDGSSGYVSIPDSPSLDSFITSITIELWLKVNQLTANSEWAWIVTKGNSSWRLMGTTFANTVSFHLDGVNGYLNGSRNVNDGQWHHVAAVYDGTNMFLYVDGTLDVSQPATGLIAQNSYPVYIGQNAEEPIGSFNGLVDEVSLYSRALTASEIQTIYAAGSGGKCALPPTITTQPANQTVNVGGTASFSVTASGAQPLSYQWNFNGTNIAGATNTSLMLTNVQFSQAGNYTVLVTNAYGTVLSSNAVLTVMLDHFTWSPIPSPRFVNKPFSVLIRAQDLTNGIFTNFTGTAILDSTNGIAITPPISGNFMQGVWTGSVMIAQTATNLVLRADDGFGHFGLANPINVISLPNLEMLRSGNIALYMWPVGYPGFVLETSGNLSPATWVVIPYSPIQIGDQYVLPLDMTGTNGFYRLRFPGP